MVRWDEDMYFELAKNNDVDVIDRSMFQRSSKLKRNKNHKIKHQLVLDTS